MRLVVLSLENKTVKQRVKKHSSKGKYMVLKIEEIGIQRRQIPISVGTMRVR